MNAKFSLCMLAGAVVLLMTVTLSQATIVQTNEENSSQTFFDASSRDVINAGAPTLAGTSVSGFTGFGGGNTAALNNGITGGANDLSQGAFELESAGDNNWSITYTLDTTNAPLGFSIKVIQTIAAWGSSRQHQHYELLYSTVAAPGTFISMGTFNLVPTNEADQGTRITLTDSSGGAISDGVHTLVGVKSIQFNVLGETSPSTQMDVYREFDVFVPEPSAACVLAVGSFLIWQKRSRAECPF